MPAAHQGQFGPGYDDLIDEVAPACAADSPRHVTDLYSRPELRIPAELIRSGPAMPGRREWQA